jgi:hypothetical protein
MVHVHKESFPQTWSTRLRGFRRRPNRAKVLGRRHWKRGVRDACILVLSAEVEILEQLLETRLVCLSGGRTWRGIPRCIWVRNGTFLGVTPRGVWMGNRSLLRLERF